MFGLDPVRLEHTEYIDEIQLYRHVDHQRGLQLLIARTYKNASNKLTNRYQLPGWLALAHARQGIE